MLPKQLARNSRKFYQQKSDTKKKVLTSKLLGRFLQFVDVGTITMDYRIVITTENILTV